ncbi:MAG: tetratricopeptide repeat protein, partial [Deltaproteobacteria bacterium]
AGQEERLGGPKEPEEGEAEESELEDALDELDFYLQQKLVEEASEELERLEQLYPGHPELAMRRQQLEQMKDGRQQQQQVVQGDEQFDLASEIEEELEDDFSEAPLDDDFQYSFEDVFSEFKKGVEKVLGKEDAATHYDLGIAYKEMGLVDDAIGEFELAAQDEKKFIAAMSMIGICLKEKGQYSEAINRFKDALHGPNLSDKEATGIYYEMGDAYEQLGDKSEALFYYQKVFKRDSAFRDVADRIEKLGGNAGGSGSKGGKDSDGSQSVSSKNRSKNNISYM